MEIVYAKVIEGEPQLRHSAQSGRLLSEPDSKFL